MEGCEFTALLPELNALRAVVLGVSPDSTESHRAFRTKHSIFVTLLSDSEKTTMAAYGGFGMKKQYGREVEGVIRSTVIIDPTGVVAHRWKRVQSKGHAEKVRQKLAELQNA